ncbi:MAG TPA: CHRD domain-containing protein [Ilumatobacter sp.]|nr:CHRD domain-containing protein [Ilumatobacter sp.]
MKTHTKIGAGIAALGIAAGVVLVSAGGAGAAHEGLVVSGDLNGRAEVATDATNSRIVGDPNGRGEAYVFSTSATNICYVVEVDKIAPAAAAHIHKGATGENGPVVVTLSPPTNGTSAGCVEGLEAGLAADITKFNPSDYYVNVHNAEYPGGAVRGQLDG